MNLLRRIEALEQRVCPSDPEVSRQIKAEFYDSLPKTDRAPLGIALRKVLDRKELEEGEKNLVLSHARAFKVMAKRLVVSMPARA